MPESESLSLWLDDDYRATHRTNADIEIRSTLHRCLHSNYMLSYYPESQGALRITTVWYPYQI